MRNFYKKIIVGTVIASAMIASGVALAQSNETANENDARNIAKTGACAAVGSVIADEGYNTNSQTWWFTLNATKPGCKPACVVNATTKAAEVNWRCTGAIAPKPPAKNMIDLTCAAAAVAARETAVSSAFSAKSSAVSAAFTKRASDLAAAWAITAAKDRNKAVGAAWKTFNVSVRAAKKAYQAANNAAWKTYRASAKTCHASTAVEPAGSTNDANL